MTAHLYASDGPRPRRDALPDCSACGASWPACKGVRWLRGRECCEGCTGHGTREETPTDAA